ncbi:hypothetical protein Pfo_002938 [Paulownia fortunei]|nr:hypothetical protein Pfo_002938 [Paulownia fortunei]
MPAQFFLERLRPLVGNKSWDFIALWKLRDDHRCLELMDCICAGTQNIEKNGEGNLPTASSSALPCRDVPEDQQVIDFIKIQCNDFSEELAISDSGCTDSSFSLSRIHEMPAHSFLSDANLQKALSIFQLQISTDPSTKNSDLPHDISIGRFHLGTSPCSPLQQFNSTSEIMNKNKGILIEGRTYESDSFTPSSENGFHEMEPRYRNMMSISRSPKLMTPSRTKKDQMNEKIPSIEENNRSDDSDPNNDDENDGKYRKRTGKGHQSKNLEAERKRRKKLNDRLYSLRALVPNISKLDRAAILGDAINYVKELQKQVKDLQIELEEHSDDENASIIVRNGIDNSIPLVTLHQNGMKTGPKREHETFLRGFHKESSGNGGINTSNQNQEVENTNEKVQQMEPQVEVFQMDGNEFFVKVFCEHKPGGFVRLMEALSSLGLQVINVNATRHTCLVSTIFRVEKRDSGTIQADHVKESLLELARNPLSAWPDIAKASYSGNSRGQMNSHHLQLHQH